MTTSTTSVSSAFLTALKNKDHNKVWCKHNVVVCKRVIFFIRLCNSFVSMIVHSWNLFSVIVSFHFQILDLVSSRQLSMKKKFHYERKDRMHDIGDKMTALLLTIKYCYREDVTEKMIASGITLHVYMFIKNWRQFSFYKQYFSYLF